MSKRIHTLLASLLVAFGVTVSPAYATGTGELKSQTSRLLQQWTSKSNTGALPADVVNSFDYESFATEAIKTHAAQLSSQQTAKYQQIFQALLKKTVHRQAGSALADTKYTVGEAKIDGGKATVAVDATMPKDDTQTSVVFTWRKKGEDWKIVDLSIDGGSLVRDYSNQFGRIIKRDGVEALLSRLDKRLTGTSEESARL